MIEQLHAGGTIDQDLEVIYWNEPTDLAGTLIAAVEARMNGGPPNAELPSYQLWRAAFEKDPTAFQILSPHRGELHGVEALNEACQNRIVKRIIEKAGAVDGITLTGKVIQIRNRPRSDMIWAYDTNAKKNVEVKVFNGEIGIVGAFGFEAAKMWKRVKTGYGPRLTRFVVQFARKPGLTVGYGKSVPTGKTFRQLVRSDRDGAAREGAGLYRNAGRRRARDGAGAAALWAAAGAAGGRSRGRADCRPSAWPADAIVDRHIRPDPDRRPARPDRRERRQDRWNGRAKRYGPISVAPAPLML